MITVKLRYLDCSSEPILSDVTLDCGGTTYVLFLLHFQTVRIDRVEKTTRDRLYP